MRQHALDVPVEARSDDVVGAAIEDRGHHRAELLGGVLTVGVAERHGRRPEVHALGESAPDGGPEPPVAPHADDACAGRGGALGGAVR